MDGAFAFITYLAGKWLAYSAWCLFGFRFFRASRNCGVGDALRLGFVRFFMGLPFGLASFFLAAGLAQIFGENGGWLFPYNVLAPMRCAEWWLMTKLIDKTEPHPNKWLWVLGAVTLSCLTDLYVYYGILPNLPKLKWPG